jgi:uracil-DNA glycosylase family 4
MTDITKNAGVIYTFVNEPINFFCEKKVVSNQLPDSLDKLYQSFSSFNGCTIKEAANHFVFSDGNPKSKFMLIGEAPGMEEDIQGKPFVGMSGQLLDKMLLAIGIDRTKCYITNIVPWRPPGNRAPTTEEVAMCLPFLRKHIEIIAPKIIVLLGGVATKALLNPKEGIMKLRGRFFDYENGIKLFPTFHPAYLLRSPSQKALAWIDWLTVKNFLTVT